MSQSKKIVNESREIINLLTRTSEIKPAMETEHAEFPAMPPEPLEEINYGSVLSENCCSEYSSDGEDDMSTSKLQLKQELANWTVQHNMSNAATNDLLQVLRKYVEGLPLDARTLKSKPKHHFAQKMDSGEYVHYGVKDALTDFLLTNIFASRIWK